ncbi:MAG: hypothetical protein ACYC6L_03915 [Anaerolineae bacterium]
MTTAPARYPVALRRALPVLGGIVLTTGALFALLYWFHTRTNVPFLQFTRDAVALRGAPWYTGVISLLGIMAWSAGAGAAFLGAGITRGSWRRYLLGGGLITAWLALDDALLLHEVVVPRTLGAPERLVYAVYIAGVLIFLAAHRRRVMASAWPLLAAALGLLALPVFADILHLIGDTREMLLAGCKLAGILCWAGYWGQCARDGTSRDRES